MVRGEMAAHDPPPGRLGLAPGDRRELRGQGAAETLARRILWPAAAVLSAALVELLIANRLVNQQTKTAVAVAAVPAVIVGVGALIASRLQLLVYAALALPFLGGTVNKGHSLHGYLVYPSDVIVYLALGAWVASWLISTPAKRPAWPRSALLGWPLLFFAVFILIGLERGHVSYGTSYFGGPIRLVLYAAIAVAIDPGSPRATFAAITRIFYVGAIIVVATGLLRVVHGTTIDAQLSTGGHRYIALSDAALVSGTLAIALLNLELDHRVVRRLVHLAFAILAATGVILAFGRTVFLADAVALPLLLVAFRGARRGLLVVLPLILPLVVVGVLFMPTEFSPLVNTLKERVAVAHTTQDANVRWREGTNNAVWQQVGFGLPASFVFQHQEVQIGQDPHNGYLYLWAGAGIFALAGFVLLLLTFARSAWRRFRESVGTERALVGWCLAMWLILAVNIATAPFLDYPRLDLLLWIVLLVPTMGVPQRR
jgi:hypothetical protein